MSTMYAFLLNSSSIVMPISLLGGRSGISTVGSVVYLLGEHFMMQYLIIFCVLLLLIQSFMAIKLASGKIVNT